MRYSAAVIKIKMLISLVDYNYFAQQLGNCFDNSWDKLGGGFMNKIKLLKIILENFHLLGASCNDFSYACKLKR